MSKEDEPAVWSRDADAMKVGFASILEKHIKKNSANSKLQNERKNRDWLLAVEAVVKDR